MSTKHLKVCGVVFQVAFWALLLSLAFGLPRSTTLPIIIAALVFLAVSLVFLFRHTRRETARAVSGSYAGLWAILFFLGGLSLFVSQLWPAVACFGIALVLYCLRRFLIRRAEQSFPTHESSHDKAA
jgi:lipopolysaccharide export LptBFGC system permease protein LptF